MADMVLQARTLPEPLFRLVSTERVAIREDNNGEIRLIPMKESEKAVSNCPFLGMRAGSKLTVDGYLERKRIEKELDR